MYNRSNEWHQDVDWIGSGINGGVAGIGGYTQNYEQYRSYYEPRPDPYYLNDSESYKKYEVRYKPYLAVGPKVGVFGYAYTGVTSGVDIVRDKELMDGQKWIKGGIKVVGVGLTAAGTTLSTIVGAGIGGSISFGAGAAPGGAIGGTIGGVVSAGIVS
ncbi:hypothetical protein VQL36_10210 [Chengkuizengella sp. SCS-71B]|uniref:hypothetical protein n=1 Tax=Chengkuizengella sp. SCS-71B TaxID=3115290 RepID=UPI0032C21B70